MTDMNEILIFLVIFLVGGIFGFVLCRITLGKKQAAAQQQELDNTQAELEHYKSQVNNHFTSSAELMEQVASSYQALYSHMAGQSQALLSDTDALPFPQLKTPSEQKQEEPLVVNEAEQETLEDTVQEVSQTDVPEETGEAVSELNEPISESNEPISESNEPLSESSETASSKQPRDNN